MSGGMLVMPDLTVSSFWGLELNVESSTTLQLLNGVLTLRAGSPGAWGQGEAKTFSLSCCSHLPELTVGQIAPSMLENHT